MMGASVLNNTLRMHFGGGMKFHRIFRDGVVCCSQAFRLRHVEMICSTGCSQSYCNFMYLVTCIESVVGLHGVLHWCSL